MLAASLLPRLLLICALAFAAPQRGAHLQRRHPANAMNMEETLLSQSRWRSIGPANMGGRVADLAADPVNPYTFYVALATGGVIKTVNAGVTWTPVFDREAVGSAGAVAVATSNPRIVWVGTGEANGRNSSSWGDGVYKSTDAGRTWTNMGLKDSQEIGRIVIDSKNPDVVFVAAAGHLWGANKERGVFVTRDGGKTWEHALNVDENTGAIDVALGAPGSNLVYAAMYRRRRYPWGFDGIGQTAAIYKSTDDGKTWKRLSTGLPAGPLGRIGLSVSASKPDVVYAVIEDPEGGGEGLDSIVSLHGGVFRSDDAGETWKRQSNRLPRGFYFSQIRVDPTNPDLVYVLGTNLSISRDGGKTWVVPPPFRFPGAPGPGPGGPGGASGGPGRPGRLAGVPSSRGTHSDEHAMWIDPKAPEHILLGTDGGVYVTYDRCRTWEHLNNFPEGEFYEVYCDDRVPFWAYGGLQDNDCWAGPTWIEGFRGPANSNWINIGPGGDGFYALSDPVDTDLVYSEAQNGEISRWNRRTNQRLSLRPRAPEGEPEYRFNWCTPFCLSHFDHTVVYVGANRLIEFTGEGKEWNPISPDLSKQKGTTITTAGSGAETYGTIVTISESPVKKGIIWCGTDDGNVQVTQDQGATWTDVTGNLPHDVRNFWVTRVEASHFDPARAYVAIDGHRSDEFAPHVFETDDYGKTFHSIAGNLPAGGPVQALREDPVDPDLLFAGTEFGAFASWDRGGHWTKLGVGLPTVAVDDLRIQPRDHALVAATHGRSMWVLDDIAPLEDLTRSVRASDIHLFPVAPGYEWLPGPGAFGSGDGFQAANRPAGVEVVYWLKNLADTAPTVTIADAKGKTVATLTGERLPGIGRLTWDMHSGGPSGPRFPGMGPAPQARFVPPGDYKVTLTVGKFKETQTVAVSGLRELSAPPETGTEDEEPGARPVP